MTDREALAALLREHLWLSAAPWPIGADALWPDRLAERLDRAGVTLRSEPTLDEGLREALDSALGEFDNIRWDDIWRAVASEDDALAHTSRKYVRYVRDDIEKARALAAQERETTT